MSWNEDKDLEGWNTEGEPPARNVKVVTEEDAARMVEDADQFRRRFAGAIKGKVLILDSLPHSNDKIRELYDRYFQTGGSIVAPHWPVNPEWPRGRHSNIIDHVDADGNDYVTFVDTEIGLTMDLSDEPTFQITSHHGEKGEPVTRKVLLIAPADNAGLTGKSMAIHESIKAMGVDEIKVQHFGDEQLDPNHTCPLCEKFGPATTVRQSNTKHLLDRLQKVFDEAGPLEIRSEFRKQSAQDEDGRGFALLPHQQSIKDNTGILGMSLREKMVIVGRRMGKSATMSDLMDQEVARIRANYDRAVSTSTLDFHNTGTFNHAE